MDVSISVELQEWFKIICAMRVVPASVASKYAMPKCLVLYATTPLGIMHQITRVLFAARAMRAPKYADVEYNHEQMSQHENNHSTVHDADDHRPHAASNICITSDS